MVYYESILSLNILALVLVFISLIFLVKQREFEIFDLENSVNAVIFGVFFLFLITLINVIVILGTMYKDLFIDYVVGAETYIGYLVSINDLALVPLFAICFFVGVFLVREYVKEYPKFEEKNITSPKKEKKKKFYKNF